MARNETTEQTAEDSKPTLLTLTEVSRRTGISMPTLQKYKKQHAKEIPSQGKGRTQRYPEEALAAFERIRDENMKKRGRPRKSGSKRPQRKGKSARPTRAKAAAESASSESSNLLTLTEVSKRTGISYPTLMRYVKENAAEIPHVGEGRKRRYPEESIEVFRRLRGKSGRGPAKASRRPTGARRARPAAAAAEGLGDVAATLKRLEKRLSALEAEVRKPVKIKVVR